MTIFHIAISLYILILNSLLIFKLIKNKKKVVIAEIFALSFSILIFIFLDNIPEFSFNKFNLIQFLYLAITSSIIFILYLHLKFIFFNKLILNNFLNLNDFGSLIDFFFLFIITSLVVFLITESTYSTYDKYIVSVILLYLISIFTTIFLFIPILLIYSIVSNLNLKNILKNNIKKEFNKILNNKNKNIIINKFKFFFCFLLIYVQKY